MLKYLVKHVKDPLQPQWDAAETAHINNYPWGGEYRPEARAQVLYSADTLFVKLRAVEETDCMRAEFEGINPEAYKDSCLEFFIMPLPEADPRYINLEFTPKGALYIGIGKNRHEHEFLGDTDWKVFSIDSYREETKDREAIQKSEWGITAQIPLAFMREFFDIQAFLPGMHMRGNFYKCGDLTLKPHYGAWNSIDCVTPDFHKPEFFGELIFI